MFRFAFTVVFVLSLFACNKEAKSKPDTLSNTTWQLHYLLNPYEAPINFTPKSSLSFKNQKQLTFQGACDSYDLEYTEDIEGEIEININGQSAPDNCSADIYDNHALAFLGTASHFSTPNDQLLIDTNAITGQLVLEKPFKGCENPIAFAGANKDIPIKVAFIKQDFSLYFTQLQSQRPDIKIKNIRSCDAIVWLNANPDTIKRLQCDGHVIAMDNNIPSKGELKSQSNNEC